MHFIVIILGPEKIYPEMMAGAPIFKDIFECSMCHKANVLPNYLPCGDFLCTPCFQAVYSACLGDDNETIPFTCPVCRKVVNTTAEPVIQIRQSVFSNFDLQAPGKPENVKPKLQTAHNALEGEDQAYCSICAYTYKEIPAVDQCVSCLDFLCRECSPGHTKTSSSYNHMVAPLAEIKSGKHTTMYKARHVIACESHSDKPLEAFCKPCSTSKDMVLFQAICLQCKVITHNHHLCSDITEAAQEHRHTIRTNSQALRDEHITHQRSQIKECDRRLHLARQHRSNLYQEFILRVTYLKEELDSCVKDLAEESSTYYQKCIDDLLEAKIKMELQLNRLTSMEVLSDRLYEQGTDLEILINKNQYTEKYQNLISHSAETMPDILVYFLEMPQVNIQALSVLFGRLDAGKTKNEDWVPSKKSLTVYKKPEVDMAGDPKVTAAIERMESSYSSFQRLSSKSLTTSVVGKAQLIVEVNISKDIKVTISNMVILSDGKLAVGVFRRHYEYSQTRQCDRCRLRVYSDRGVCLQDWPIGAVVYGLAGGRQGELVICGGNYQCQNITVYSDIEKGKEISFKTKAKGPGGLAINNRNEVVIATDCYVQTYTLQGKFVGQFEDKGKQGSSHDYEQMRKSICVNERNDIFVSIPRSHCVRGYKDNGELIFQYGGLTGVDPFVWPRGITTDSMGHVIVADVKKGCLHVLGSAGQLKCKLLEGELRAPRAVQSLRNCQLAVGENLGALKFISYLYDKDGKQLEQTECN